MSRLVIASDSAYLEDEKKVIGSDKTEVTQTPADILNFLSELTQFSSFDTGLMPEGVRSIRTGDGWTQVTYVLEPEIRTIFWGDNEGGKVGTFRVAMPWLVFTTMFHNGQNTGARVFYSPKPITSLRDPLYHTNWANVNCRGYGARNNTGNGVGWICLYHRSDDLTLTFNQKLHRMIERVVGGEPFNNGNMSGTDGARFYHSAAQAVDEEEQLKFLWDIREWEAKTEAEGLEWVFSDDLWIPILVAGIDDQRKHEVGGIPLTLGMVMYGDSSFYYGEDPVKHMNKIARTPKNKDSLTHLPKNFVEQYKVKIRTKKVTESPHLITDKAILGEMPESRWTKLKEIPKSPGFKYTFAEDPTATAFAGMEPTYCDDCGEATNADTLEENGGLCNSCA